MKTVYKNIKLQGITVNQTGHGFASGDVLKLTGAGYAKAQANTSENSEVVGIVTDVINSNIFKLALPGDVYQSDAVPNYSIGTVVFLSATTAGAMTDVEPGSGNISKPLGVIYETNNKMFFYNWRGIETATSSIDASNIANGLVSNTEFQYLDGVTSAIQTQIDGKSSTSHNHDSSYIGKTAEQTMTGKLNIENDLYVKGDDGWNGSGDLANIFIGDSAGAHGVSAEYGTGFHLVTAKTSGGGALGTNTVNAITLLNGGDIQFNGCIKPYTSTNSSAPNNSIFYSSDNTKLVYKDSSGNTNNLHGIPLPIKINISTSNTSSSTTILQNAIIEKIVLIKTTAYNSGTTISVTMPGSLTLASTSQTNPQDLNSDIVEVQGAVGASNEGVISVNITSATSGAGYVIIYYYNNFNS